MADNVGGQHIQGVSDEGFEANDGYPVVVAFKDTSSPPKKKIPTIGPSGGVLVENAPGGLATTVNQGLPNAGGALAWPTRDTKTVLRTAVGVLTVAGDTVPIACLDADTVWFSLSGSYTGKIVVDCSINGGPFTTVSFYAQANGHIQFTEFPGQMPDVIGVSTTGWDTVRVTADVGFVGTPSVSVTANAIKGNAFVIPVANIALNYGASFPADHVSNPPIVSEFTNGPNDGGYNPILFAVLPILSEGGDIVSPQRTPTTNKQATATAAGSTVLWTPTAGKKFRLMRYMLVVTDDATQAAPGRVTVKLLDATVDIGQSHITFVPAVGLLNTGALYTSGWIDLGNGILSAAANNVLNINLSAALTAGLVNVLVAGTEE